MAHKGRFGRFMVTSMALRGIAGFKPILRLIRRDPAALLAGLTLHCPFCGYRGPPIRRPRYVTLYVCPGCKSSNRHRLLHAAFSADFERAERGMTVLHVAPERGLEAWMRGHRGLDYETADLHRPGVDHLVDLQNTSLPYDTYDIIICNHVLEHVADDRAALAEMHRLLRPGGTAVLSVPIDWSLPTTREDPSVTDPSERERLFGASNHLRLHGADFADRLGEAGFSVTVFRAPNERVPEPFLVGADAIFLATRPL